MLPLQVRVDLGVMVMKRYSAFPKAPALLEPHHQMVSCHIQETPLQRQFIQQPHVYTLGLDNCISCTFILTFFVLLFLQSYLHTVIWYQVFLSNTNNLHMVIWYQVFLSNTNYFHTGILDIIWLSNTNNLHTVIWYQLFLSNTNNLHTVIWYQVFLSNTNNCCMISRNYFYLMIVISLLTVIGF